MMIGERSVVQQLENLSQTLHISLKRILMVQTHLQAPAHYVCQEQKTQPTVKL